MGKFLLNFLIEKGYRNIILEVSEFNFNAIKFYISLGFKIISTRKQYYSNNLKKHEKALLLNFKQNKTLQNCHKI